MRKVTYSFFDAGANDYLYRKGFFHCWGVEYEEFESGPGNYTVAIIETPEGNIVTAIPNRVEFETPPKSEQGDSKNNVQHSQLAIALMNRLAKIVLVNEDTITIHVQDVNEVIDEWRSAKDKRG